MPMIDKKEARERNEGKGAAHGVALLELAKTRAVTDADLFLSLSAMVMRQNPNLGAKLLGALELTIRQRPEVDVHGGPLDTSIPGLAVGDQIPVRNVSETADETVTETVKTYCAMWDDTCHTPEACKAARFRCARHDRSEPGFVKLDGRTIGEPSPPADVAFDANRGA